MWFWGLFLSRVRLIGWFGVFGVMGEFSVEESVEEVGEEFVERVSFRAETAINTGPCLLLSVVYDGESGRALLKLYDFEGRRIYYWYDSTGHKPYCLSDLPPDEIVEKYPDVVRHRGFDHFETVKKYDLLRDRPVVLTKIVAKDPLAIGGRRDSIREILGDRVWEGRIKYHLCYIYDRGLIPGMIYCVRNGRLVAVRPRVSEELVDLVAKYYPVELRDEIRELCELLLSDIPRVERVALDIEVFSPQPDRVPNPRDALYEVIAVAVAATDGFRKVFLLKRFFTRERSGEAVSSGDYEVELVESERELLEKVFCVIASYPVVLTFNGDSFDLRYLYHRALKLGFNKNEIPIALTQNEARVSPGIHIDLYKFFFNKAIQNYAFGGAYKESKTLDAIAEALLGVGKVHVLRPISELNYSELAKYCFRDADLTLRLTTFNDDLAMNLMILLARIAKLPIDDLTRSGVSNWIKNMMYFEHRRKGYLIPEPRDLQSQKGQVVTKAIIKGKKYLGAIVITPVPGIFFDVTVVDFASLYPSAIKKWNLSYETVRCPHKECMKNVIPGTNHWVCKKRMGLSSKIIGFLRDLRVYVFKPLSKKENIPESERVKYKVIQSALKVFINASYGVFGAETFPLYCPPVAESTTALGRHAISMSILKALELGLTVLYGDTDSLFLWKPDPKKLEELFKWVDEELGIDLDIDKEYKFVAFSGRKKNYLGVMKKGGRVDIKGLVGKKRNTPEFIKKLFSDIVEALAKIETLEDLEDAIGMVKTLTKETYTKLKKRQIPLNELSIKVTLSKHPREYTKNTPQHVKAARQLMAFGKSIDVGDVISFVKVRGHDGVKALQLARIDEIDEEKYLAHIKTSCEQILEALGISFDEITGDMHLTEFFE